MSFVPTKYPKYQQNIERNSSFWIWKCQNFLSSLTPLAHIYIDFLKVLSVCCRLYRITISNKRELYWLYVYANVKSSLRYEMIHVYEALFFCRYNLGVLPPPPPIPKKLATLLVWECLSWLSLLYVQNKGVFLRDEIYQTYAHTDKRIHMYMHNIFFYRKKTMLRHICLTSTLFGPLPLGVSAFL